MSKISTNSNYTCIYNSNSLLLIHPFKCTTVFESFSDIQHIEMDQFILNNLYIISSSQFTIAKCKNSFQITMSYKFDKQIENIEFVKYLYFQNRTTQIFFFFVVNDRIYFIKNSTLFFIQFEEIIKEAFVSLDKTTNEYVYLLDSRNNVYFFHIEKLVIMRKFNVYDEMFSSKLPHKINFILNEEGLIFFNNQSNGKTSSSSVLIKNSEVKMFLSNKFNTITGQDLDSNNNYNYTLMKFKEDEVIKFIDKRIASVSYKQLSSVIFSCTSGNKLYVLVYWNKKKKINFFEIRINKEYLCLHIINKSKRLKINILVNENLIWIYKLEHKKGTFKIVQEKTKEIIIEEKKITINNFVKKTQTAFPTKHTQSLANKNSNWESFLSLLNEDAKETLKEEIIASIGNKLEDENYCEELSQSIVKITDEAILKYQTKLQEYIATYTKTMEKTIYEEKLLSKKLEKLIDYYSKIKIN